MRSLLVLTGICLLTGCSRDERAADFEKDKAVLAQSAIIDRHVLENSIAPSPAPGARPMPGRAEPVRLPVPIPPSSESRYRAIGTEPFWSVLVKGSTATLERPDKTPIHYTISRDDDGRAVRYLGDGFTMTATEGPCSDGMSDAVWSDRVTLAFGEGTLKGCGGVREDF